MTVSRIAFADESGTGGRSPCYSIGVVSMATEKQDQLNEHFSALKRKHGVEEEVKWTRVRKGHGLINLILDALDFILRSETAAFDAIVVCKELYRNWHGSGLQKEQAFYQTYTLLLRHIAHRVNVGAEVFIDDRSDAYAKRHEVVEKIGNRMLAKLESQGRLESVTKVRSKDVPGIQVADVLTGAITSAHCRHRDPSTRVNAAKSLAIKRLASMIGWDDLCYDTFPHAKFNIWHFPTEYRACPESRDPVPTSTVPYVKPHNLKR